MLVTRTSAVDSVGGGVLEHMAIQRARADIRGDRRERRLISFPLDRESQQCCGGIVVLLFEPLLETDAQWLEVLTPVVIDQGALLVTALGDHASEKLLLTKQQQQLTDSRISKAILNWRSSRTGPDACLIDDEDQQFLCEFIMRPQFKLVLFGAGHVGRALIRALAAHRCQVLWVDAREQEFPSRLPDNVSSLISSDVAGVISASVDAIASDGPVDFTIASLVSTGIISFARVSPNDTCSITAGICANAGAGHEISGIGILAGIVPRACASCGYS